MKIILLDKQLNKLKEVDDMFDDFWWAEGNGSCDCSRSEYFEIKDFPCGNKRFLVVWAENYEKYSNQEYNAEYENQGIEDKRLYDLYIQFMKYWRELNENFKKWGEEENENRLQ